MAACTEVGRVTAVANTQAPRVRAEAAKLLCVVLQMDATVLAALLGVPFTACSSANATGLAAMTAGAASNYQRQAPPPGISDAFAELALPGGPEPVAGGRLGPSGSSRRGATGQEGEEEGTTPLASEGPVSGLELALERLVWIATGSQGTEGTNSRDFRRGFGNGAGGMTGRRASVFGAEGGMGSGGREARVCPAAWEEVDASSACEVHLDNLELYRCGLE